MDLSGDPHVDIGQTNLFDVEVSLAIVEGFFWFVRKWFKCLLQVVGDFPSLVVKSLEGIPIQKMPPESFPIMEFILFLRHDLIAIDIVIGNIFIGSSFGVIKIFKGDMQWYIFNELFQSFADFIYIFVYVSSWNCLEEVL